MTKIAISVLDATGLDAQISPHFGRCPYFTVVEVEAREVTSVESVANPYFSNHQPGEVPGFIHSIGADVMLSGGMGGRAVEFFQNYGITPATGASGIARDALNLYLDGGLTGTAACTESTQHGH
ncbi:MAG: dinitrogenase iron-molybdenum cofactor biosynthesis protein [Anaerolineales bacterium]|nr:MAG: dinitrogenase iron-molybdenum cofactor biosynthesis protein [Anaerolineales bacterium]